MALLRLIRWQNLLIILLTQFLAWGCVVLPAQAYGRPPLLLDAINFMCLSASTILIAAAGYIINDYFDVKIDTINHPEKVILGNVIPRKAAIILHTVLNVAALLLAGYVAGQAHHYEWLLLQLACTLLLWFYSTHFKRQYITGNVVVALLSAFTILVILVYEPAMHLALHIKLRGAADAAGGPSAMPVWVLTVYAYFAFTLTWIREIVKDMQDLVGDEAEGCVTMPIKIGIKGAARFAMLLAALAIAPLLLGAVALYEYGYMLLAAYTLLLLAVPLIAWLLYLPRSAGTAHYGSASRGLKLIMVSGICSLLIYHFQTQ